MPTHASSSSVRSPLFSWLPPWTDSLRTWADTPLAWLRAALADPATAARNDEHARARDAERRRWEERLTHCETVMAQLAGEVRALDATVRARLDALEARAATETEEPPAELVIGDAGSSGRGRNAMFRDVLSRAQQVAKAQGLVASEAPTPPQPRRQRKHP